MWYKLKQFHKQRYGTHQSMLGFHPATFLWKLSFKKSFATMIEHIKIVNNFDN